MAGLELAGRSQYRKHYHGLYEFMEIPRLYDGLFLGALQSVPSEIYEAASIDGASGFQILTKITLPSIKGIIKLVLFLNLSGAISAFEFPFVIYPNGSPLGMSDTFMTKTMQTAFSFGNYGLASAWELC